jgi:hypothetical protein
MDPYSHALHHAEDFLYNDGPRFDFRHEAWPLLPEDIKQKILQKAGEHSKKTHTGSKRSEETKVKIRKARLGFRLSKETKVKMREARIRYCEKHPNRKLNLTKEIRQALVERGKERGRITKDSQVGIFDPDNQQYRSEWASQAGKIGGKNTKAKKVGIFDPELQNLRSEWASNAGKKRAARTNSIRMQCTVTGHISNPGGLTTYQRARGIDPSNRIKLPD